MEATGRLVGGWVDLLINVTVYNGKKERHKIRERATAAKHEEQQYSDSGDYGYYLADRVSYTDIDIDWFDIDETVEAYLHEEFGDLGYLPTYELLYIDEASFVED